MHASDVIKVVPNVLILSQEGRHGRDSKVCFGDFIWYPTIQNSKANLMYLIMEMKEKCTNETSILKLGMIFFL